MAFFGSLFENKNNCKDSATKIAESFSKEPPAEDILAAFLLTKNEILVYKI